MTSRSADPKYPDIVRVERQGSQTEFKSRLVVLRPYAKGERIVAIEGHKDAVKRWSSVQIDTDRHIELHSELVFMNHSCDPSANIETESMHVVAARDLKEGDELTFFYPSSEWEMSQPFACWCGAEKCIKQVSGAKDVPADGLANKYLTPHIRALLAAREKETH
ncbi:hypothetical protein HDU86_002736 [Geranomyces michiganensis]|nr:hypothetical protein HDU86_002736 [Geranomyces michiganensis]